MAMFLNTERRPSCQRDLALFKPVGHCDPDRRSVRKLFFHNFVHKILAHLRTGTFELIIAIAY
jgi:hypothetical protein